MYAPHNGETPPPDQLAGQTGNGAETKQNAQSVLVDYRARRMTTQRAIARICIADALATFTDRYPGDLYRVVNCLWCRAGDVSVVRSVEHNRAHYKGLQTCGSVWICPCCASKIEERRRAEVAQVFAWAESQSLDSTMFTNTFSHGQGDNLRDLFSKQSFALASYRQSKTYRTEMKRIGYVGMVRSLEITHGLNGFHPHTHESQFHNEKLSASDAVVLRFVLVEPWLQACTKAGLYDPRTDDEFAFRMRSLDVKHNFTAANYLAKQDDSNNWTPAHEIAKASSKQGRSSGVHPFQLALRGNPGDPALFIEYARATKGKRKLLFSPGLKARAGVVEKSDNEIAAEEIDNAQHIANVTAAWQFIRKNDSRAAVLEAAERDGKNGIVQLLYELGFDPYGVET